MFSLALSKIKEYDRIIIHRHSNPDGDALGSQIGLKNIIKTNFPTKEVLVVGDTSRRFAFMKDSEMDDVPNEAYADALAIILDTSSPALISDDRYKTARETFRFDHHIFIEKIADNEVVDTSFESCAGLITAFAKETGLALSDIAARSLYTGMVTDSGRFRYDSTNARTFELASFLLPHGVDIGSIYQDLYADDFEMICLRASFVLKVKFTKNNVAYIYTSADELKDIPADTFTVSRGMVGVMSDVRGVDIWVNFTETEKGVLCEIRSSKYNINPIAVKYGGGGHAKASGATVLNKEVAMEMLSDLDKMTEEKI